MYLSVSHLIASVALQLISITGTDCGVEIRTMNSPNVTFPVVADYRQLNQVCSPSLTCVPYTKSSASSRVGASA